MWGKTANVIVQIARLSKTELAVLVREVWQNATPPARPAQLHTLATKSAPGRTPTLPKTKTRVKPRSGQR
jgi:hypothetical protein